MAEIRYLKITLVDGTRFILRVTSESPRVVNGYEVNADGEEIVPAGYELRWRMIGRDLIKKVVELRMDNTYATLKAAPRGAHAIKQATLVNIVTDTTTLAEAMYPGGGLTAFNIGVHEGRGSAGPITIPIRKLTGREVVTVAGTSSGARVISDETWISDRFGKLGARQIKHLRSLVSKEAR